MSVHFKAFCDDGMGGASRGGERLDLETTPEPLWPIARRHRTDSASARCPFRSLGQLEEAQQGDIILIQDSGKVIMMQRVPRQHVLRLLAFAAAGIGALILLALPGLARAGVWIGFGVPFFVAPWPYYPPPPPVYVYPAPAYPPPPAYYAPPPALGLCPLPARITFLGARAVLLRGGQCMPDGDPGAARDCLLLHRLQRGSRLGQRQLEPNSGVTQVTAPQRSLRFDVSHR